MDSMVMGVKHFEVVNRGSHADKKLFPDEIRV